jgi:hypothetical protein
MTKLKYILTALLCFLGMCSIYVYHMLLLKASSIGDTKVGLGNPVQALQIENEAGLYQIVAAVCLGASAGIFVNVHIFFRILISILVAVVTFLILFIWCFQI